MMHVYGFRVFVEPRQHEIAHGWVRAGSLAEAKAIIGHRHVEFETPTGTTPLPDADCPAVVWQWSENMAAFEAA